MAQPVWVLSVDLQTKTATFTSGLADAAKGARTSFADIKQGAQDMGRATSGSMMEARHGVMLLGEEFGVHLPRALTTFISSIGPVGAAMEAAFPFLAIIVGATLLLEHLSKIREEGLKLTESQVTFGTTVSNVLNGLNDKLLQAGIRTDELNHNHLGALNKQLELIDHQSMAELVQAFGVVSKAADLTFAQLKTSWYQWGSGAAGAKNALEQFKTQYDSLLAQGKDQGANDLLAGTLQSAKQVLDLQKQAHDNESHKGAKGTSDSLTKFAEAQQALKKQNIGYSEKEVEAQQTLVDALQAQVNVQSKVNELRAAEKGNAVQTTQNHEDADQEKIQEAQQRGLDARMKIEGEAHRKHAAMLADEIAEEQHAADLKFAADQGFAKELAKLDEERGKRTDEAAKIGAEHETRMAALVLAAKREGAQSLMAQGRETASQLLDIDRQAENQAFQAETQALQKELAALNQHDAEYQNKQKALNGKLEELQQQHNNKLQQLEDQASQKQLAALDAFTARMRSDYANGFSQVIMGKQSFARMMEQIDSQLMQSALKFALQSLESLATVAGRQQLVDARTAAADAWRESGNPITGSLAAVATFASVMALQDGGIVPGVGKGDTVHAMLEPGEGVLTNKQMDGINYRNKFGNDRSDKSGGDVHVHHHATYNVQAFNSDGVDQVLKDHGDKFVQHATRHLRNMNR